MRLDKQAKVRERVWIRRQATCIYKEKIFPSRSISHSRTRTSAWSRRLSCTPVTRFDFKINCTLEFAPLTHRGIKTALTFIPAWFAHPMDALEAPAELLIIRRILSKKSEQLVSLTFVHSFLKMSLIRSSTSWNCPSTRRSSPRLRPSSTPSTPPSRTASVSDFILYLFIYLFDAWVWRQAHIVFESDEKWSRFQ